jgi:flagellar assembly protein FliH
MKFSEPISFTSALIDVRLVKPTTATAQEPLVVDDSAEREQAAYERGRHDGEIALREQLIAQRNEMAALLNGVIDSLQKTVPQLVHETESALIQLALESAQKIVAGMPIKAELVESVVREALQQVEDTAEIVIQLHPDDLVLLRKHKSDVLKASPNSQPLQFSSSPEVTRGGCLLRTRFGIIDARRETKVDQLREALAV